MSELSKVAGHPAGATELLGVGERIHTFGDLECQK